MSQSRWDDLYDRLSSRKLWLTLMAGAFAVWNYLEGRLTPVEFQTAITAALIAYLGAEGLSDAAGAFRSTPDQVVSVDASTTTTSKPLPPLVAAPKRVRPSRAKPKETKS